ncbi:MAG: pentapeptide repeat-containing protein [Oscillatoria princeps RMCB-10]|jgi:uncharacterized protein YjbI with pentapeptide repeats|nr:pentapeptide repeat-containing protein [Oscillatoria princeps RMCB-10]
MPKNYSGQNLKGRNFRGKDLTGSDFSHSALQGADFTNANLTGANFSHADIRSANFTKATLRGANFSHAKAGLQRYRAFFLLGVSFLIATLLGFASGLLGLFAAVIVKPESVKPYVAFALIFLAIVSIIIIIIVRRGYAVAKETWGYKHTSNVSDRTVKVSLVSAGMATVVFALAVILTLSGKSALVVALVIFGAFFLILSFLLAVAMAGAVAVAGPSAIAVALTGIIAVAGAVARVLVERDILKATEAIILVVFGAVILGFFANYIGLRALAGANSFAWMRMIAVNFAASGGTSFRKADLTQCSFTYATLKNTDFREANLTHTCFISAQKLDESRQEGSENSMLLVKLSVQELLVTGNGHNKSYVGVNLRGAYLKGANLSYTNLTGVDLSGATLQGACLEWANLAQAQAIGTDFTNAQLTGARGLGTWNIDSTTQLEWVDCRFVYLLEDCKPGTDDRERRPSSGEFAQGDFTKLFQEVLNTVDFIFRNGIDWKAFTYSFNKLVLENEDAELEIQSIENQGDGVVVVRVRVSPGTDKERIHSEFTQTYQEALKALEERYHAELKAKDEQIATYRHSNANMMEVVRHLASRPASVYQAKALTERKSISGKLVILNLGQGDFNTGFPVTLQIGTEGEPPSTQKPGYLPPAPKIPETYTGWQSIYHNLDTPWRISVSPTQKTNISPIEDCRESAQILTDSLNSWLNSEEFRPIKDVLLRKLDPSEEIRLILQTENNLAHRLPWQLWDFFENYPKAEIALSAPEYDRAEKSPPDIPRTKVRILAILGNSANIDIEKDRQLIKQLPDADPTFLSQPTRRQVDVHLWDEAGWDILFFAGHSHSQEETGCIYINATDSLTVAELKYALRAAVERGLKLAIFNSCDGLGLARDLADLRIPQIIVMREPVPDAVAEAFLQDFVKAFAGGKSLYASVREAREKLHAFEDEFPCASWLPVICQHPAEIPLTWEELRGVPALEPSVKEL